MIISVIPVSVTPITPIAKASTQVILSGMDKDVAQVIPAALFQTCVIIVHRGLSSIYHHPLLIMLR